MFSEGAQGLLGCMQCDGSGLERGVTGLVRGWWGMRFGGLVDRLIGWLVDWWEAGSDRIGLVRLGSDSGLY